MRSCSRTFSFSSLTVQAASAKAAAPLTVRPHFSHQILHIRDSKVGWTESLNRPEAEIQTASVSIPVSQAAPYRTVSSDLQGLPVDRRVRSRRHVSNSRPHPSIRPLQT